MEKTDSISFHKLLRDAREKVNHSPEAMAILLGCDIDYYCKLEEGESPDDDLLRRICVMMGWNYYTIKRLVRNQSILSTALSKTALPQTALEPNQNEDGTVSMRATMPDDNAMTYRNIGQKLKYFRQAHHGESLDIICMMLGLDHADYLKLEAGEKPTDEQLRRICTVLGWNYYDSLALMRSEQASQLQPNHGGMAYSGNSAAIASLRKLAANLEVLFSVSSPDNIELILTQLRLITDSLQALASKKGIKKSLEDPLGNTLEKAPEQTN